MNLRKHLPIAIVALLMLALAAPSAKAAPPTRSQCAQARTWMDQAINLANQVTRDATDALNRGDDAQALAINMIGRHDVAAIPNPGAADQVRDADLAVLDNLGYQTAMSIAHPYSYIWDDASFNETLDVFKDELARLQRSCGWSSSGV